MTNTHHNKAFSSEPNIDLAIPDTCLGRVTEQTDYLKRPFLSTAQLMNQTQVLLRTAGVKHSITYCSMYGAYVKELGNEITAEFYSNGKMKITGARKVCRNRVCPLCSVIKSSKNIKEIENFFIAAKMQGMLVQFFTFTKNGNINIANSMKEALSGISKVNEAAKNWRSRKGVDIATCGIVEPSFSREKNEIGNYQQKTCHIHVHGMVAYPADMSSDLLADLKQKMEQGWSRGIKLAGGYVFTQARNHHKVYDWRAVVDSQEAVHGLARYFNETMKGSKMGHELTSQLKDKQGRGIHTLLQDICLYGCPEDTQLFIQYFKATINEKTFRKSSRWRAMAKTGSELRSKVENRIKNEAYHWVVDKHEMPIETSLPELLNTAPSAPCAAQDEPSNPSGDLEETLLQWKLDSIPKDEAPILHQINKHTFNLQMKVNRLNRLHCQTTQNIIPSPSLESYFGLAGIPALPASQLEQQIINLNNKIRGIREDVLWQQNMSNQEEQIRKDNIQKSRRVKLVDSFSFPIAIWEALTWHSLALWPVLDWLNREAMKEEKSSIYSGFKEWLYSVRKYTDTSRRVSLTIIDLDTWVDKIYQENNLTRPKISDTVRSWAS